MKKHYKLFLLTLLILLSNIFPINIFASDLKDTLMTGDAKRNIFDFYVITSYKKIMGKDYVSYEPPEDIDTDLVCFILTRTFRTDTNNLGIEAPFPQHTMMWNKYELDLTKDFLLDLELQFRDTNEINQLCHTNNNDTAKGGMGMAFVMIPLSDTNDLKRYIGDGGPHLGVSFAPYTDTLLKMPTEYIAVEFDTYCNKKREPDSTIYDESHITFDHIAIITDENNMCHMPLSATSSCVKIDPAHPNVKDSAHIYCVRIKWENRNNNYYLTVFVKNKTTNTHNYLERLEKSFDSLGQVLKGLSASNPYVNWGMSAGAEFEEYSSTQRVIFKNLIVGDEGDEYLRGVYITEQFPFLFLYLVNLDSTRQFLYPTLDNCDANLRHFKNSNSVCIEDAKEILIGRTQDIASYGIKINWYDMNDSLLESNNNKFDILSHKNLITDREFNIRAELIRIIQSDTIVIDLYFTIYFKNPFFVITDTNCINIGDTLYYYKAKTFNIDKIKLPSGCIYEFTDIDSSKFQIIPYYNQSTNNVYFKLIDSLDICETEFGLSRLCSNCSDTSNVKIKVYNYKNILSKDIRVLKSCSGPKIQIAEHPCSNMLNYGLKFYDNTWLPIIDNQLPLDTNNFDILWRVIVFNKNTNTILDEVDIICSEYDVLFPFYQEAPRLIKLDRSGELKDTCNYIVYCKLLSSLDTTKYEISSNIYNNRKVLFPNDNLELLDTIQMHCTDSIDNIYVFDIICKADSILPSINVCSDTLNLNCSCNSCYDCDLFQDEVNINIARDSAGVLIDLGGNNGFATKGRYCKFRININDYLGCDSLGDRIIIHSPSNNHGEWLTSNLDSLVYLVSGSDGLGGELYELVKDTIRISYITPQGDTCYKEKIIYCDCYAGVEIQLRPNAYPEMPTICDYSVKEMFTGGIIFLVKDIQGNVVQNLGMLNSSSPLDGEILINTHLLSSGIYFVVAEKNGFIVSYSAVQFIKQ